MSKETWERLQPLKKALEDLCYVNCKLCPFSRDIDGIKYICSIMQHFQTLLDGTNFLNTIAPTIIQELLYEQKNKRGSEPWTH